MPRRGGLYCLHARHLYIELQLHSVPHEIVAVDDGSTDRTWAILQLLANEFRHCGRCKMTACTVSGGRSICGLNAMQGDGVMIMMADESDDCRDVVRYWKKLNEGYECVFGSRFGARRRCDRLSAFEAGVQSHRELFLCVLFRIGLNDTTNAFKAYRKK